MILLSLVLVVASATTLGFGVFDSNDVLVWTSLVTGLGAVALVAGAVVRRRRLVPGTATDVGPAAAGSVAVGSASAGFDPAPSPTPSRPPETASGPVSAPGPQVGPPSASVSPPDPGWTGTERWPWATPPPAAPEPRSRPGWTGPVPAVPPPPPASSPAFPPAGSPAEASAAPAETPAPADADWDPTGYAPPAETRPAGPAGSGWDPTGSAAPAETPAPADADWDPTRTAPPAAAVPAEPEPEDGAGDGEPGIERVAVRDALRVAQLGDEVVVVDGHPRYHLADCPTLGPDPTSPLAVSVARRAGFTPCAVCGPDAALLARARARASDRANGER